MTTLNKTLIEISAETIQEAKTRIQEMVITRKLVIEGNIPTSIKLTFPSKTKEKEFRKILSRVIHYPTMKNSNVFLQKIHKYSGEPKSKVEYSSKEKRIQTARKEWKEALLKALELRAKYKEVKGNFYK